MKTRAGKDGAELAVRWTTEKWTPEIRHVAGAEQGVKLLRVELPLMRKAPPRKKQVLWTRGSMRLNGRNLPGLNGSRTTWR